MIKHYITNYEEKGRLYAEAWLQINVFHYCYCFSKKKIALPSKIEKAVRGKKKIFHGTDFPVANLIDGDKFYDKSGKNSVLYVYDGEGWKIPDRETDAMDGKEAQKKLNKIIDDLKYFEQEEGHGVHSMEMEKVLEAVRVLEEVYIEQGGTMFF